MQYDMVFEGGGAKGIAFVGALTELEARGHTSARLLGASAGAIMATFLAAGYRSQEMAEALNEEENGQPVFLSFLEKPPIPSQDEIQNSAFREFLKEVNLRLIPDFVEDPMDDAIATVVATSALTNQVFSFIERGGIYAAQRFLSWLETKLDSGTYPLDRGAHPKGEPRQFSQMNLREFFHATGVDLSLVASDTSDHQMLILNHRTAPECPVVWAVRMSMSFPLLWHEVVWQREWGPYREEDITGNTIVDGGMLSNFPIELFLSDQPLVTRVMGEKTTSMEQVLGFLIDETIPVPDASVEKSEENGFKLSELETVQRVLKLIDTMTQAHDKMVLEGAEDNVVRLPAKGFGTTEFGMSEERRNALVAAGRHATQQYFDRLTEVRREAEAFAPSRAIGEEAETTIDRIATKILSRAEPPD